MPAKHRAKIDLHLQTCARCQCQLAQMQRDIQRFLHAATRTCTSSVEQGLLLLLTRSRDWAASRENPATVEIDDFVVSQLEVFFGAHAAQLVEKMRAEHGDPSAIPSAEPLLAAFLGHKTATRLINCIRGLDFAMGQTT